MYRLLFLIASTDIRHAIIPPILLTCIIVEYNHLKREYPQKTLSISILHDIILLLVSEPTDRDFIRFHHTGRHGMNHFCVWVYVFDHNTVGGEGRLLVFFFNVFK